MKQIALDLAAPAAPGFDDFIATDTAAAAALQQLRTLNAGSAPLYLWGPTGSGKTHLLCALAAQWRRGAGPCVGWFDAASAPPWRYESEWRLVVLDECERYDAARQHAAFTLFVEAAAAGAAIAAAGRVPPIDLPLRDDLRTRLGWGPVFALEALGEAGVCVVLRREAERRGIALSDEVLAYLLTHFARDLGSLMTLLERLDGFALAQKRAVTVPLLRQMLNEGAP